jgi:hypothetical protein
MDIKERRNYAIGISVQKSEEALAWKKSNFFFSSSLS